MLSVTTSPAGPAAAGGQSGFVIWTRAGERVPAISCHPHPPTSWKPTEVEHPQSSTTHLLYKLFAHVSQFANCLTDTSYFKTCTWAILASQDPLR